MVAKLKTIGTETKKSRVKVGKLKLNKETIKDLTTNESKAVRGGLAVPGRCGNGSGLYQPAETIKGANGVAGGGGVSGQGCSA